MAIAHLVALAAYVIALVGHELPSWGASLAEMDPDGEMTDPRFTPAAAHYQAATQVSAESLLIPQPSIAMAVALVLIGAFFVLCSLGLARLSTDEHRYPDRVRSIRIAARIIAGIAAFVGVGTLTLGIMHLAHGWPAHSAFSWMVLVIIEVTFGATACVGWLYLRPIARRGGRAGLAKLCGYLLFLPLLAFAKAAPFIGLWFLYLLMPLATFLPLIYLPLSAVLFVRFARMTSRAAPHAEAAWAAESEPAA